MSLIVLFDVIGRYTFEVAPVFILMEDVVLKKMREIVGYKGGDGIFTPGKLLQIELCFMNYV